MRAPVWLGFFQGVVPFQFVIWVLCGGIASVSIALAIRHGNLIIFVGIILGLLWVMLVEVTSSVTITQLNRRGWGRISRLLQNENIWLLTRILVATVIIFFSTFLFAYYDVYVIGSRTTLHGAIIANPFDSSIKSLRSDYSFNKEIEVLSADKVAYKIRIFTVLSLKATEDEVIGLARKFDNPDKEMKDRVTRVLTQGSQEAFSELRSTDVVNTLQVSSAIVRKLPESQLASQNLVITRSLEVNSILPISYRG